MVCGRLVGQVGVAEHIRPRTTPWCPDRRVLRGIPLPQFTESTRETLVFGLLAEVAQDCSQRGEQLALVVDGLDEDRGLDGSPDAHSIAALLPIRPPVGMRVIVSGRDSPPLPGDVPDHHTRFANRRSSAGSPRPKRAPWRVAMAQVVQIVAAVLVLAAFGLERLGLLNTRSLPYLLLNMFGSEVLAMFALPTRQWGVLVLEGAWALISAAGVAQWVNARVRLTWQHGRIRVIRLQTCALLSLSGSVGTAGRVSIMRCPTSCSRLRPMAARSCGNHSSSSPSTW